MVPRPIHRTTYPLSAMFVLMAACAMLAALVAPVVRSVVAEELGIVEVLVASVVGGLVIMVLGGILGLYHYRPLRGVGWGLLIGGLLGILIGPVILAPVNAFATLLATSLGGAALLLVVGLLLRRATVRAR